jgi:hypothetical protein
MSRHFANQFNDLSGRRSMSNDRNDGSKRGAEYFSSSSECAGGTAFTRAAARKENNDLPTGRNKENKNPREVGRKKGRSKSLSNRPLPSPGGQFGRGKISRRLSRKLPNSAGPMILSRRLSYRINNNPGMSPIVATTLSFTPNKVVPKGRSRHHSKSSLEKIGQPTRQSRATRNSV